MILNVTDGQVALLSCLIARLGDQDVTEWLEQENAIYGFYYGKADEKGKEHIRKDFDRLSKKVEDAIRTIKRKNGFR
ncbi:hypothetical protein [Treponema socranskii]